MFCSLLTGLLLWLIAHNFAVAVVDWTVIHTDTESSIDLWTKDATGCPCPYDPSSLKCACCVSGGCHCGAALPSRCSQCGLENRCLDLCNVTIDARSLAESSNKTFGQIKAPMDLRGQTVCWYKFRAGPEQRIELQIYRIVGMGQKNGTSCLGAGISWYNHIDPRQEEFWKDGHSPLRLCGLNERYFPPVTLFGDSSSAALVLRFDEHFDRSRFLAYFSFTDAGNEILGFQTLGGIRTEETGCDYSFHEEDCRAHGLCTIASPGFPGLYPPNRTCKFVISTGSPFTVIRLHFSTISFAESLCMTDDVLIFSGNKRNRKLLARLCSRNKTEFLWHAPEILIEFRSGGIRPALEYNGFKATIHFENVLTSRLGNSTAISEEVLQPDYHATGEFANHVTEIRSYSAPERVPERVPSAVCDYVYRGSQSRSGLFSSEASAWRVWPAPCTMHFIGNPTDTVLVNLMKFRLRGPECRSYIEIFDIQLDVRWPSSPLVRICSPGEVKVRNGSGLNAPQIFGSRGSGMALRFKLDPTDGEHSLEGAFQFLRGNDPGGSVTGSGIGTQVESIDGAAGLTSGQLVPAPLSFLYWNSQIPLKFVTVLEPEKNQSVLLEFHDVDMSTNDPACVTDCGRGGCICRWTNPMVRMDFILVQDSLSGGSLVCLCGKPTNFLPLRLSSNRGITLTVVTSSYSWPDMNVDYNVTWHLRHQGNYHGCEVKKLHPSSGFLQENRSVSEMVLYPGYSYYYRSCSWLAQMEDGEQLISSISTSHAGPCSDWNATFSLLDTTLGEVSSEGEFVERVLKVVCPDQQQNMFVTPPMVLQILIRLTSFTMVPTDYRLQWQTAQYIIPTPGDRALSPHSTEPAAEWIPALNNISLDGSVSGAVPAHSWQLCMISLAIVLAAFAQSER